MAVSKYIDIIILVVCSVTLIAYIPFPSYVNDMSYEMLLFAGMTSVLPWVGCTIIFGVPARWFGVFSSRIILCGMVIYAAFLILVCIIGTIEVQNAYETPLAIASIIATFRVGIPMIACGVHRLLRLQNKLTI